MIWKAMLLDDLPAVLRYEQYEQASLSVPRHLTAEIHIRLGREDI